MNPQDNISVLYRAPKPKYVDEVTQLCYAEWKKYDPDINHYREFFTPMLRAQDLPVTFVCIDPDKDTVLATASLVENDLPIDHPYPEPWLASVVVAPEYRTNGLGRRIVLTAVQWAATHLKTKIMLYTPDTHIVPFYQRLGAKVRELTTWFRGEFIVIMEFPYDEEPEE